MFEACLARALALGAPISSLEKSTFLKKKTLTFDVTACRHLNLGLPPIISKHISELLHGSLLNLACVGDCR